MSDGFYEYDDPEDPDITITLSGSDATMLYDLIGQRPHNEQWSNRVYDALRAAMFAPKSSPEPQSLRA